MRDNINIILIAFSAFIFSIGFILAPFLHNGKPWITMNDYMTALVLIIVCAGLFMAGACVRYVLFP